MSVQCCTCFEWVYLRCSLIFFSRFKTLCISYSWSCPPCCVSASSGYPTPTHTVTASLDCSSLYTSTVPLDPAGSLLLMQNFHLILVFKPFISLSFTSYLLPLYSHPRLLFPAVFLYLMLPSPLLRQCSLMECWRSPIPEN